MKNVKMPGVTAFTVLMGLLPSCGSDNEPQIHTEVNAMTVNALNTHLPEAVYSTEEYVETDSPYMQVWDGIHSELIVVEPQYQGSRSFMLFHNCAFVEVPANKAIYKFRMDYPILKSVAILNQSQFENNLDEILDKVPIALSQAIYDVRNLLSEEGAVVFLADTPNVIPESEQKEFGKVIGWKNDNATDTSADIKIGNYIDYQIPENKTNGYRIIILETECNSNSWGLSTGIPDGRSHSDYLMLLQMPV